MTTRTNRSDSRLQYSDIGFDRLPPWETMLAYAGMRTLRIHAVTVIGVQYAPDVLYSTDERGVGSYLTVDIANECVWLVDAASGVRTKIDPAAKLADVLREHEVVSEVQAAGRARIAAEIEAD